MRKLAPLAVLTALAGYWGPWVNHKAVALVLTGLDMGEFVKFLPQVRAGEVSLVRELFYLPLFASSVILVLLAANETLRYPFLVKGAMLILAATMALAMLPPVWTPQILIQAEFRKQTIAIGLCLLLVFLSPLFRRLPLRTLAWVMGFLSLASLVLPVRQFELVRPSISALYNHPIKPGWGLVVMAAGFSLLTLLCAIELLKPKEE